MRKHKPTPHKERNKIKDNLTLSQRFKYFKLIGGKSITDEEATQKADKEHYFNYENDFTKEVIIHSIKKGNYRLAWLAAKAMVSDTLNPGK